MPACSNCSGEVGAAAFCPRCGADQRPDEAEATTRSIRSVLWAFALVIGYVLASNAVDLPRGMGWSLGWDVAFFLVVGSIAYAHRHKLAEAIRTDELTMRNALYMLLIQAALTILVLLVSRAWEDHGIPVRDSVAEFRGHRGSRILAILSIAVFPALTEEMAFRGILFSQLERLTTRNAAIVVTGFIFAWTHFSFISLIWLVPAGLFFGWMRSHYRTIWYGVLCHFAHNATVVLLEM